MLAKGRNTEARSRRPILEYNPQPVTAVSAGLMSEEQILDMMTREITPEDFEMLLLLDETNDKKYKTVQKDIFEKFDRVAAPKDKNYECRVCLEPVCDSLEGNRCARAYHVASAYFIKAA